MSQDGPVMNFWNYLSVEDASELTSVTALPAGAVSLIPVTKQDIEEHFSTHGSGKVTEIKLMNGFGFIEYEDAMDARDIVPGKTAIFPALR